MDHKFGTQIEVDVVERQGDERSKVGNAVVVIRSDGCSISVAPWSDITLTAGNGYELVLKPGSDRELFWPTGRRPNSCKSSLDNQAE